MAHHLAMKQIRQISGGGGMDKSFLSALFQSSIPNKTNTNSQISSTPIKSKDPLRILAENNEGNHQNNSCKTGVNSNEIFKSSEEKETGMQAESFLNFFFLT